MPAVSDRSSRREGGPASPSRSIRRAQWAGWSRGGVEAYYGIRYARLLRPDRPRSVAVADSGQIAVDEMAQVPVFPQLPSRLESVTGPAGRNNPQADDAFFLNVWTPDGADRLPVLVFLHGGAWASGGGAMVWYRGERLAGEGIVVVTVNYRLGPSGHLDDGEPGAYHRPFEDLVLALRWVKASIARFGGDPDRVTLAGQSAGAWYAWALAGLPMPAGLFSRVALLSIPQIKPWTPTERTSFTERVMAELAAEAGGPPATSAKLLQAGARALTARPRIAGAIPPMYQPVLTEDAAAALADAPLRVEALYVRLTTHEMSVFLPPLDPGSDAATAILHTLRERSKDHAVPRCPAPKHWDPRYAETVRLASWLQFGRWTGEIAAAAERNGQCVVRREFAALAGPTQFGAVHCVDLPFQFGNWTDWIDAPILSGWQRDAFEQLSGQTRTDLADFVKGRPQQERLILGEGAGPLPAAAADGESEAEEIGPEYSNLSPGILWGASDLRAATLRRLLGVYPTGVAVVTTCTPDGRQVGLTINSFASLSLEPPLVLWSLGNNSGNLSVFESCTHFAINMLSSQQEDIARRFANSRLPDKFAGVALHRTPEGVPIIDEALTVLVCVHDHCRMVGDHLLLIGRVVRTSSHPGEPLVFHTGRFIGLPKPTGAKIELESTRRRTPKKADNSEAAASSAAWRALMDSEHGL